MGHAMLVHEPKALGKKLKVYRTGQHVAAYLERLTKELDSFANSLEPRIAIHFQERHDNNTNISIQRVFENFEDRTTVISWVL